MVHQDGPVAKGRKCVSDAILRDTWVTTRKPHKCFGCRDVIPAGTQAWYTAGKWDGDFSYYLCETCNEWVMDNLDRVEDFGEGDVKMDMEEAARDAERERKANINMD